MRFVLPPSRQTQNPLVRIAAAVVAVACLGVLIPLGALALAVLLAGGLICYAWFRWRVYRMRRQAAKNKPDAENSDVIEGEYVVVHEHREHTHDRQA